MGIDLKEVLTDYVDLLMPELTPHESAMYIFLLRLSYLAVGEPEVRIGQRTIAQKYGRGPKMSVPSRQHITRQVESLEEKGCIRIGDTNREGTLYTVFLPREIPLVREKTVSVQPSRVEDFYTDPDRRREIFVSDNWRCHYCGELVAEENVTLDHLVPVSLGGTNVRENLRTACLLCNSIKSGKTYDQAAPYLLRSIQERRNRSL